MSPYFHPNDPHVFVIPKTRGGVVGAVVLLGLVLFFTAVAIGNLLYGVAWTASVLWLGLLLFGIALCCWERGFRKSIVDLLGECSSDHFADVADDEHGTRSIRFGFQLFRRQFFLETIPVTSVISVDWDTGQATSLAGQDMNDWHVALWFDRDEPAQGDGQKTRRAKRRRDVLIVGPLRKKEMTVAFGREFLAFLKQAGIVLVPEKDEHTFVRERPA